MPLLLFSAQPRGSGASVQSWSAAWTRPSWQCATGIQKLIGGEQTVITPVGSGRVLGRSVNNPDGEWFEHVVVAKKGMLYDGFTGRAGMSANDFKVQFNNGDLINFGF